MPWNFKRWCWLEITYPSIITSTKLSKSLTWEGIEIATKAMHRCIELDYRNRIRQHRHLVCMLELKYFAHKDPQLLHIMRVLMSFLNSLFHHPLGIHSYHISCYMIVELIIYIHFPHFKIKNLNSPKHRHHLNWKIYLRFFLHLKNIYKIHVQHPIPTLI